MTPARSALNCTCPPFASLTACATSIVTVPTLGLGIRLRGPRTLPSRPTTGIMSGVAMQRSKLISPPCTVSMRSSAPTMSAPAASASSALGPRANTATRTVLPVPLGRPTTPRTIWSAWRGSTPRLTAISTVSSNFARAFVLIRSIASSTVTFCLPLTASRAARVRFPIFAILFHLDAHGTRAAKHDLHRGLHVVCVQVSPFGFRDFADLLGRDRSGGVTAGCLGSGLQLRGPLEVIRRRGRLDINLEGLVLIIGDHRRAWRTLLHFLRLGVECLAEFHDVDTALTKRRPHGRGRVGLSGGHLKLHRAGEFLGHLASPFFQHPKSAPPGISVVWSGSAAAASSPSTVSAHPPDAGRWASPVTIASSPAYIPARQAFPCRRSKRSLSDAGYHHPPPRPSRRNPRTVRH